MRSDIMAPANQSLATAVCTNPRSSIATSRAARLCRQLSPSPALTHNPTSNSSTHHARTLKGMRAVVTGTAQGIGRAIADRLAASGVHVHRVDKDTVDLSDSAAVNKWFAALGDIDILVNVAGGLVGQTHKPIDEVDDSTWNAVLNANLTTMLNCSRAAATVMKKCQYGRIVTISSGAGRSVSLTGVQAYTTAKAAQIGLTRQLAHELGHHGITVNCICPGFVLSNPTTQRQWDSYGPAGQEALVQRIAVRRIGTAEDIARAVDFFVAPEATWITGQVLSVDGGHSMF